jgi:hypothetical protein
MDLHVDWRLQRVRLHLGDPLNRQNYRDWRLAGSNPLPTKSPVRLSVLFFWRRRGERGWRVLSGIFGSSGEGLHIRQWQNAYTAPHK